MSITVHNKESGGEAVVESWKAAIVALAFMPKGSGARNDNANSGDVYAIAKFRELKVIGIKNDPDMSLFLMNSVHDFYGPSVRIHEALISSLMNT